VVLGAVGYFGVKSLMGPKAATGSSATATATAARAVGGVAQAGGALAATAAPAGAADATNSPAGGTSGTGSSAATAWRDADPSWMEKFRGKLINGFKTEPGYKAVALTFDDGPNGETQYILKQLAKYGGQATFFNTGRKLEKSWAKTQPAIIWKAGSELGNHTQHHTLPDGISSLWRRSYAIDLAEIKGPEVFYNAGTGRNSVWLRPMGGMIDKTGIKAAVDTDHLVINWTIDSNDSHGGPRTPDYIYNEVVRSIKSGDVVLLHVTHPESMEALPRIAKTLDERGFKMVTLSELAQHSTGAITQRIPE
jgi:peptidoglycan-N-acetylglucosamine deacetylase